MTAAELLAECQARRIVLQAHGGQLDIDAPAGALTAELLQRLRDAKAELLAMLQPRDVSGGDRHGAEGLQDDHDDARPSDLQPSYNAADWTERETRDGRVLERPDAADLQIIDVPPPCPNCGGIVFWWDAAGGLHCVTCSPGTPTGQRLRQRATELRVRYPVTPEADLQPQPVTVPRTWPAAVPVSILADPIPTCRDCGRPRSVVPGQPGRTAGLCFLCWSKRR